jgi:hypothetical protein
MKKCIAFQLFSREWGRAYHSHHGKFFNLYSSSPLQSQTLQLPTFLAQILIQCVLMAGCVAETLSPLLPL